jgi:putative transposase
MDFVHDQLDDGTRIRALTIIDTFTRYVPAIDVRRSCTGADVVETLERVCAELGYLQRTWPKSVRIDQGPEFISKDLDPWPMPPKASNSTFRGLASRRTTPSSRD